MRIRMIALMAMLGAFVPDAASANELFGVWQTTGGRSRVEIKPCDKYVCANIVWLKVATNANGQPLYDRRNEAAELRDRPVMGILVLKVAKVGSNKWKGRVYNPEAGKTYPAEVSLAGPSVMKVTGCGLGGLVCKTKSWKKVGELVQQPMQIQANPARPPAGGGYNRYPPR